MCFPYFLMMIPRMTCFPYFLMSHTSSWFRPGTQPNPMAANLYLLTIPSLTVLCHDRAVQRVIVAVVETMNVAPRAVPPRAALAESMLVELAERQRHRPPLPSPSRPPPPSRQQR